MVDTEERQMPRPHLSKTSLDKHQKELRERIFKRGIERDAIPDAAVTYPLADTPPAVEVRFIRHEPPWKSPLDLLKQSETGLQAAPLWAFVDSLPTRLDLVGHKVLKQKYGQKPVFIFMGADGFLWVWHYTLAGCCIERLPIPHEAAATVWIVGYKRP